jgi:hypothetical protein
MRSVLIAIAIFLVFLAIRETCMLKTSPGQEGYADQVMHGIAGGIAGPILDASLYDYDAPRYPLPPKRRAAAVAQYEDDHPTALWAMPPEAPV